MSMADTDDIHNTARTYERALERLQNGDLTERNKKFLKDFMRHLKANGRKPFTLISYLNTATGVCRFIKKDINAMNEDDYFDLIEHLERKKMYIQSYQRFLKSFFGWCGGVLPGWVQKIHPERADTPVQPSDLLTKEEIDRLLNACTHPEDKAFISVIMDSGMRIGALGTLKIKNVKFLQTGAVLYISTTSRNRKTTEPQPIPITWSTGYLNAWLSVHPQRDNPDAPLWIITSQRRNVGQAQSYQAHRNRLKRIAKIAGIDKKKIYHHLFRHMKVTEMIKMGFSEQQIKFQAGWSPTSTRMLKVYGNFIDQDMVNSILVHAGLKVSDQKPVTLKQCPRCYAVLVPEARACHQCALILDAKLAQDIEDRGKQIPEVMEDIMKNPEFMKLLNEAMKKNATKP